MWAFTVLTAIKICAVLPWILLKFWRKGGDYIARNIPGATLKVLDAAGHFTPLSAPDEVTRIILSFV